MNINRFQQFEAYAAAVVHADLRLMLPRLIEPSWEVATQSFGRIDVQFGKEGSGIIAEGAVNQGGQTLFVPIAGLQFANGQPLHNQSMLVMGPGSELTISSQEAHSWCSVYLPSDLFNNDNSASTDRGIPRLRSQVVDVGINTMTRLRRLLVRLDRSLRSEPTLGTCRAASKFVQRDLLEILQPILAKNGAAQPSMGRPPIPRREIIRRINDKIEQHEDGLMSMEDLILAAEVSERTLRNIFVEYFGLPPQRYLIIKRLHQVRATLQKVDPECATVSAVAAQFGFWHFGRFARDYRRLFGEAPSRTLKSQVMSLPAGSREFQMGTGR